MKDRNEFAKKVVKIGWLEEFEYFGLYPFPYFVEHANNKQNLIYWEVPDINDMQTIMKKHYKSGAKRIYLAIDFSVDGDITSDFVTIFSFDKDEFSVFALTYNIDGKLLERIEEVESEMLQKISREFKEAIGFKEDQ